MGQQPNIELEISDLPRPTAAPGPARRWAPRRPGELGSPGEVPWGGAYGTAGPDTGYALTLAVGRTLELAPGEHRHNVDAAVAALAGARASHLGRAPTPQDVDVAVLLLGLDPAGIDDELVAWLASQRHRRLANLGHDAARRRALVAATPIEVLEAGPDEIRARMAAGERLLEW
jgi:hypothetical protein